MLRTFSTPSAHLSKRLVVLDDCTHMKQYSALHLLQHWAGEAVQSHVLLLKVVTQRDDALEDKVLLSGAARTETANSRKERETVKTNSVGCRRHSRQGHIILHAICVVHKQVIYRICMSRPSELLIRI